MKRRHFLQGLLGGAIGTALPARFAHADEFYDAFHQALAQKPWLAPYLGAEGDLATPTLALEGKLPPACAAPCIAMDQDFSSATDDVISIGLMATAWFRPMWAFGAPPGADKIVLYDIHPDGTLARTGVVDAPGIAFMHDFVVTRNHLVFLLMPMIRFDYVHFADFVATLKDMRRTMRGEVRMEQSPRPMRVVLAMGGRPARQTRIDTIVEFPRVDPRVIGRRHRYLYTVARGENNGLRAGFNAIARFDFDRGVVDRYDYGSHIFAEEHIVVPRPGSVGEGDGWLIGTAYNHGCRCTMLSVFEAKALHNGPIAQARLPYVLPLGFHGNFAPA